MDEHNNIHMFNVERNVSHCVWTKKKKVPIERLHVTGNAIPKQKDVLIIARILIVNHCCSIDEGHMAHINGIFYII